MEEWRVIKGYENYSISNLGRVMNNKTGRMLKPYANNKKKTPRIDLNRWKKRKQFFIHHLVWDNFVGTSREGMVIDHIDNVQHNNRLDNLRLCTPKENTNWYWREQRFYE